MRGGEIITGMSRYVTVTWHFDCTDHSLSSERVRVACFLAVPTSRVIFTAKKS